MVMLDSVAAMNDPQQRPRAVHRSLVTKVFRGIGHQEAERQDQQLDGVNMAQAGDGKAITASKPMLVNEKCAQPE